MFDRDHLGPNEGLPTLDRWTVDLADGKVRRQSAKPRVPTPCSSTISWPAERKRAPSGINKVLGEFVFHPSFPDAAEDDGVLMGYVYGRPTDCSELAIVDAQTLQDIASIKSPHRVPAGFHGNWVPSAN